jgi:hypothetical protein
LPHVPPLEHVWTPLPEHCVAPGEHEPVQLPAEQTFAHGEPLFCQLPALLQTCGC